MYKFLQLLFLALLICSNATDASAVLIDGIDYEFSGTEATVSRGQPTMSKDVIIPPTITYQGSEYTVTKLDYAAFMDNEYVGNVTLPPTIKELGEFCFKDCTSLQSVNIPEGITIIPVNCFYGCTQLSFVNLPSSLTLIENYSFYQSGIKAIIIPDKVTLIEYCAFKDCNSLEIVTLGEALKTIQGPVFSTGSIKQVWVAGNPTEIDDSHGGGKSLGFPSSATIFVKTGLISSFKSKPGWSRYTNYQEYDNNIPSTIEYLNTRYEYDAQSDSYLISNQSESQWNDESQVDIIMPDYVTANAKTYKVGGMVENAFASTPVHSITLPSSLNSIPKGAFKNCSDLNSVIIPDNVETIGSEAFEGCKSLSKITLGKNIKSIGNNAFSDSGLRTLKIEALTPPAIEWGLGLSADVVVAVPASLVDIYKAAPGWSALNIMPISPHTEYDEVAIEGILYRYDANSGGYMVIPQNDDPESNYNNLTSAIIPESITVIDTPYTVTGIAANAFAGSPISSISLPSSIKSIPEGCFSNCTYLTQVTIPENVTSIGNNAFALCSGITKITVEAMTPPVLGNDVFPDYVITNATLTVYKSALENYENAPVWKDFKINAIEYYKYVKVGDLTFRCHPDSMTASVYRESDDESNYSGFGGETITIPENVTCDNEKFTVTSISSYAFRNAVIRQLNIPSTITSIESLAFLNAKISKVDIPSLEQWIDIFDNKVYDSPFDPYNPGILLIEGEPLTKVTIEPASKINSSTFYGCSGITTLEIADKVSRFETSYLWAEKITDLILGADLTNISKEAVANLKNIKRIVSKNLEAPSIPANSFAKDVANSATLYLSPFVGSSYYYNGSYNAQGWWVFSDKIKYFDITLESYPDFVIGRQKLEGLSLTLANKDFSGELIIPKVINSPRGNLSVISFDGLEGCSEVTSIDIPESLEQIGRIEGCTSLKRINLTNGVNVNFSPIRQFIVLFYVSGNYKESIFNTYPDLQIFIDDELLTDLIIPAGISNWSYWFSGYKSLTSLTIPGSIESIANRAFACCVNLEALNLEASQSALALQDDSFEDTKISKLNVDRNTYGASFPDAVDVTFGNKITSVGSQIFENAVNLKKIEFSESINTIGEFAFKGCTGIEEISFTSAIKKIGQGAFKDCSSLEKLNWDESAADVVIEDKAFEGCSTIESLVVPAAVISIGNRAFADCQSLSEVVFKTGNYYIYLGGEIFAASPVKEVLFERAAKLSGNNSYPFSGIDGSFNLDINVNVSKNLFRASAINQIHFGSKVTTIGDMAFFNCGGIQRLIIPANVSSVGGSAFEKCNNLYEIEIEDSPESLSVDLGAFMNCAMENLYLGRTIKRDYSVNYFGGVFAYNPKLKSVELGQYVTKIENYEFLNCPNIYSFTVGVGVRKIEQYAVGYIPGSTDYVSDIWKLDKFVKTDIPKLIWLPNTRPQGYENLSGRINYVSQAAYQLPNQKEYRNLSSKFWVDGVLYVFNRQAADRTCVAIDCKYSPVYEETSVPSEVEYKGIKFAVEEINDYTFFNENYMKRVEIGNNIAQIGDYAFSGCANLTSVFVPNGVKTLGEWAFTGCKKLESVVLGNGLKEIRNGCFSGDENIAEIMVPANVSTIGNQVFDGCKGLSKLEIMNRDTDLNLGYSSKNVDLSSNPVPGRPLFADCELKEVYIGGNITYSATVEDGYSPFYRNDYIEKVTIFDHETEVSDYEFYGCRSLKEVYIGNDVEKIGVFAFSGCLELDIFSIGNKVKIIGEDAFSDCGKKMTKFISHTTVPPVCGYQALDDIDKFDCVLYVPASSVDAYANAEQWKNFFNIRPITDVAVPVTSVTFDVNTLSMEVGDQNRIEASVLPENATDSRLVWESDNIDVAMVSQFGNVVAIGEGSCYITASTTDGSNLSASCFVTVTDNAGVMEVTVSDLGVIRNGNSISIVGAYDADKVSVFTVGGNMVYGGFEKRIDNLPAGLYIVIVRNHVFKIMI